MSRIDELIAELCPDGVEFKAVGDIATYTRGVTYSKNDEQTDGAIRVLRSNNITLSSNTVNFDDVKTVSDSVRVRDNQWLRANDVLISAASGSKAHVGKVAYIYEDIECCFGGFMAVLRTSGGMDSRFLFHLLIGSTFSNYLDSALSTSTINNLNASIVNAFRVPVPPLEVQREIVKVLDTFTTLTAELTAELEAELEARRRQYQYYRDALLTFGECTDADASKQGLRWTTLGEVISALRTGLNPRQNFKLNLQGAENYYVTVRELGGFEINISEKTDRVDDAGLSLIQNRSKLQVGDVLFSGTGTIGRTALVSETPNNWNVKEGVYVITPNPDHINARFLIYLLHSSSVRNYILAQADGSTVVSISMAALRKIPIPIPPLEEQARIVAILDKFDALTNSITEGLPREIELRRKQYEHYRDRLLSFPQKTDHQGGMA